MKKRILSVIVVLGVVLTIVIGNKASATEGGLWFVFSSFDELENAKLINETTGKTITLGVDELFDFETTEFIYSDTQTVRLIKNYADGTIIEQQFEITGAESIIGIYDDGTHSESWMEVDEKYTY